MKRVAVVILLTINYFLFTTPIYAQKADFNISINPFILEIEAYAPASPEADILIENKSEKDATLDISLKPFTQDAGGTGQIVYFDAKEANARLEKIKGKINIFEQDTPVSKVKLAPFESKTLKLRINIDKDFPSQDHYFTILFTSEEAKTASKSTVNAGGGVGTHIILSTGQKQRISGRIIQFTTDLFKSRGPVNFNLLLSNTGERYVIPRGHIEITNILSSKKNIVDILPQYLLAGSKRYLVDAKQAGLSSQKVVWEEKFLFGIYKATAYLKLSEKSSVIKSSTYFIAIPFIAIFVFSIAAFMLVGILFRVFSKLKKNRKLGSE